MTLNIQKIDDNEYQLCNKVDTSHQYMREHPIHQL